VPVTAAHDESGTYGVHRHFVTGFIFVLDRRLDELVMALRDTREAQGYWGEIHYSRIRGTGGDHGAKYKVARDWVATVEHMMWAGSVRAHILAVDVRAPGYDHARFRRRPHYAYNRFTRMALEAGVRWCFGREALPIQMRILSDAKTRRPGGDDEIALHGDNFTRYLPMAAEARIRSRPGWPRVSFTSDVQEVAAEPYHVHCSTECELIQVADLIVSSV
jgi:hypothetical protein